MGLGTTAGAQSVLSGALWVELFGEASVGRVRGVYAALMVLATAVAPMALGLVFDTQMPALVPALAVLAYVLLVTPMASRTLRMLGAHPASSPLAP